MDADNKKIFSTRSGEEAIDRQKKSQDIIVDILTKLQNRWSDTIFLAGGRFVLSAKCPDQQCGLPSFLFNADCRLGSLYGCV